MYVLIYIRTSHTAGTLLVKHGMQFDVVYTSWLSRAIETAWLVLNEMDLLWLPISKSWRLNERSNALTQTYIQYIHSNSQELGRLLIILNEWQCMAL